MRLSGFVKYISQAAVDHLLAIIQTAFEVETPGMQAAPISTKRHFAKSQLSRA